MNRSLHTFARMLLLAGVSTVSMAAADDGPTLQLAEAFGRHMVLQRDRPLRVWGMASPGEQVTVTFSGQSKTATAESDGRWTVELAPPRVSTEPATMTVRAKTTIVLSDLLVGDVWLYIGDDPTLSYYQGRFESKSRMGKYYDIRPFIAEDVASGRPPRIRSYNPVPGGRDERIAVRPVSRYRDEPGAWHAYDPADWGRFGGFSYFFGRDYWRATRVPVGILVVAPTHLESMTPPAGLRAVAELREAADEVLTWDLTGEVGKAAHRKTLSEIRRWGEATRAALADPTARLTAFRQPPRLPGPKPGDPAAMTCYYNGSIHPIVPMAVRGLLIKPLRQNQGDPFYVAKAEALIRGLREVLDVEDAPTAFFQMRPPMYWEVLEVEDQAVWMQLRAVQQGVAAVSNTSVLAAHDFVEDPRDPRNWAERAARWAIAVVDDLPGRTGPSYRSHRIEAGKVTVAFDHVAQGLMAGDKRQGQPVRPAPGVAPGGFELAGPDGRWHVAVARIVDRAVVLHCKATPRPLGVRYAWSPSPAEANLYNEAGFPAASFQTTLPEKRSTRSP